MDGEELLKAHEQHSAARADDLLQKLKGLAMEHGITDKVDVHNVFKGLGGMGHDGFGGMGGLGAGLGGLLIGALLSRNGGGLFGGNGNEGGGGVQELTSINILSKLGDIQGAIPLASAQTENVILNQTNALTLQNAATKDAVQATALAVLQATSGVNTAVLTSAMATQAAVNNDGDKTRALIQSINDTALNRIITTQANEITELRNENRRSADTAGIRIDMINNQNQLQAQQQQQGFAINSLCSGLASVEQLARATNTNLIVGNTGVTSTGAQTANPVNVRA